ncbi:MAG: ATP-binding cassette domain-containing protein [Candidatus Dojkabacteria bacterium]|nr:ATP-binding cassette domain-containing protein [Candidatus Dojkabacteria bacterium]
MINIKNIKLKLTEEDKIILNDFSLEINKGEIVVLTGKNGSGKSSLVNGIMGKPDYEIIEGRVEIIDEEYSEFVIQKAFEGEIPESIIKDDNSYRVKDFDINKLEANQKSLLGIYLANQYPLEIPGVSLMSYLRLIYNNRLPKDKQLPVFKFKQLLNEKIDLINYPKELLKRNLNEGFSGGEKKKTEILQMLMLDPKLIMLDEIDSGLDKHSIKDVFGGIRKYKIANPNTTLLIITHYEKVFEFIKADRLLELENGKVKDIAN